MTRVLAIDPGNVQSAWALIDAGDCRPIDIGKADNVDVRRMLTRVAPVPGVTVAIEMVASYGMPVGREIFDTVLWAGRYVEIAIGDAVLIPPGLLVYRGDVKLHLCQTKRAKDSNIAQALADRFAPGAPNRGKGTKARPGWFYGFRADIWAAYAVAVYAADRLEQRP